MKNNLYTTAWTIIQNCCEASVAADQIGDILTVHLANFAASCAAERIGIPECELLLIRQQMAEERCRPGPCHDGSIVERTGGHCRAANENVSYADARSPCDIGPDGASQAAPHEGPTHRHDR